MTKKLFSLLAVLSIAAMACLSSCSPAGVECGLIGKWEYSESKMELTIEISSDDKVTVTSKVAMFSGTLNYTVKSVSDHTVTIENDETGVESKVEYKNLGCDSVDFKLDIPNLSNGWFTYKKVN